MPEPHGRTVESQPETSREERSERRKEVERRHPEERAFMGGSPRSLTGRMLAGPDFWRETMWPVAPFAAMQSEMARWMDEFWRGTMSGRGGASALSWPAAAGAPLAAFAGLPCADMKETDDKFLIHVELPGLKAKDIEVRVEGDDLIVRGIKAEAADRKSHEYRLSERRFGEFERRIPLPHKVEREAASAEFHDGVLTIDLPKRHEARRSEQKIAVRGHTSQP